MLYEPAALSAASDRRALDSHLDQRVASLNAEVTSGAASRRHFVGSLPQQSDRIRARPQARGADRAAAALAHEHEAANVPAQHAGYVRLRAEITTTETLHVGDRVRVHVVGSEVALRVEATVNCAGVDETADTRAALRLALPDDAEHRLELIELFLLLFRADERRRVRVPRVRGEKLSGGFGGLEKLGNNHRSSLSEQNESAAFSRSAHG